MTSIQQSLTGCLAGGAAGDAPGSRYEGRNNITSVHLKDLQGITDNTQFPARNHVIKSTDIY